MNILKGILVELRERRLWPVAVALLAGLIAVPVLLSKSPTSANAVPGTSALPGTGAHGVSVRLASTGGQPSLHGPARDPFSQQAGSAPSTPASAPSSVGGAAAAGAAAGTASIPAGGGASTGASHGGSTGGSSTSGSSGGGGSTSGGGSSSSPAPSPSPAPSRPAQPGPSGLKPTQSYAVAIQVSNPSGGLNLIDPIERMSPLPSQSQPLLVELGVQQGGGRVLFAVLPGTVVQGPGSCTPGPIDCEVLSLSPNESESVSTQAAGGATIAVFAVTGITAQNHPSVAAANQARNAVSGAGADLINHTSLPALSLFDYEPSVGAVVDLRNLTVGGN